MLALLFASAFALRLDVPVQERCERAPVVAVLEVTSREVRWVEGPDANLETLSWAHVADVWKGRVDGDTIELHARGGRLPSGLFQRVEHEVIPALDQRFVALLTPHDSGYRIYDAGVFPADDLPAVRSALGVCLD